MININSDRMKEYELSTHDSYVNCINNDEIREFYERYTNWLERINLKRSNNSDYQTTRIKPLHPNQAK